MAAASQLLAGVVGVACVILGGLTAANWLRHRDRSRAFLALSIVLLSAVGLAVAVEILTLGRLQWLSDLTLTLFLASGWAFLAFRDTVVRLPGAVRAGASLLVAGTIVLVVAAAIPAEGAQTTLERVASLLLTAVWLGCVVEPILRLLRLSAGLPSLQRARLRSITLAYMGVIVVLVLAVVASLTVGRSDLELTVALPALAVLPLFYVGFAPPRWLRAYWRQREEESFRSAFNDLLLYSHDRQLLADRAVEWAARLVGAGGAIIASDDGEVLAVHGLDRAAAWEIVRDISGHGQPGVAAPGPVASAQVISVRLDAQLSGGVMAVTSGPLTPLFGEDEAMRLNVYGTSLATALDRVMLVERMRRSVELLDLAYDAVITWSVRTQAVTFWNHAAEELYGWAQDEALGRDAGELLRTELPAPRPSILSRLRADGRWEGEIVQTTKDGDRIHVAARWALQTDATGGADTVLEIARDITADRIAAEELRLARDLAEQASQAKSEYLSRMSHELRTPLTAILGYSDLLEMREPRGDQGEAIAAIQEASGHLLSLVNDVLDIARIESGREAFVPEPVSIEATVEECVRLIAPAALEHHTRLARELGECVHDQVLADRQHLVQALLNLLSNAVKYSGEAAEITVRAERESAVSRHNGAAGGEGGRIRISVQDTGPGLSEEAQQRLFQPFERLGAERTTVQGTGLGLALTKKLVEGMNGEIGVRSAPGEGSTFWVAFDRAPVSVEVTGVPGEPVRAARRKAPERTVLYVEDNLATVGLMEDVFAMRPLIRLITAMQGGLTLDLAREHHPDLIVLDLHLPDIQGDEVLERLRADPRTARIPVVMCSADATERQRRRLIEAGAYAYLTKPVKVQRFLRMLDEVLSAGSRRQD